MPVYRMSNKDILKTNVFLLIFSAVFLLMGVLLPLLPVLIPTAEYSELIDKEIVIESVEWVHQYKGTSYHRITTTDGEQYNITGGYFDIDIEEALPCGKTVSIKYYENKILFATKKYAEVIAADGVCIVHYDNDEDNGIWVLYLLSACCFLIGAGAICFVVWQIRHNRKKQAKRNQKIIRKYGSIRK